MKRYQVVIMLIVGVGLVIFGIHSATETTVDCGGQTMQAGDTCETFSSGGGDVTRTVSQQLDHDHSEGWISLGIGAVMALGGGIVLFNKKA